MVEEPTSLCKEVTLLLLSLGLTTTDMNQYSVFFCCLFRFRFCSVWIDPYDLFTLTKGNVKPIYVLLLLSSGKDKRKCLLLRSLSLSLNV